MNRAASGGVFHARRAIELRADPSGIATCPSAQRRVRPARKVTFPIAGRSAARLDRAGARARSRGVAEGEINSSVNDDMAERLPEAARESDVSKPNAWPLSQAPPPSVPEQRPMKRSGAESRRGQLHRRHCGFSPDRCPF